MEEAAFRGSFVEAFHSTELSLLTFLSKIFDTVYWEAAD